MSKAAIHRNGVINRDKAFSKNVPRRAALDTVMSGYIYTHAALCLAAVMKGMWCSDVRLLLLLGCGALTLCQGVTH